MSIAAIINRICPVESNIIDELEAIASKMPIKKGEHLTTEGSPFSYEVIVTEGLVRTYYKTLNNLEYNSNFYLGGQFLSPHFSRTLEDISLINIQALETTEVVLFDEKLFTAMRHNYPSLQMLGNQVVQRELQSKCRKELLMATSTAHDRYEKFLREFPSLINRISLQQVAMYLGISPVSLSRIRSLKT